MTGVSVLVPWRPTPEREAVWSFLRRRWAAEYPDWQVVEGDCGDGPWCKAAAVADALSRAEHDLLVIADADVWCDGIGDAVAALARAAALWAIPHTRVLRLTEQATQVAIADGWPPLLRFDQRPYRGYAGGGMTVLSRTWYERIPLDPRFVGWGHEDEAWASALYCLRGRPWRGLSDLWHLWHPPQQRTSRAAGSPASVELSGRYGAAARNGDAMTALLDEFRVAA